MPLTHVPLSQTDMMWPCGVVTTGASTSEAVIRSDAERRRTIVSHPEKGMQFEQAGRPACKPKLVDDLVRLQV